ncbi:MAG: Stp1/IreP family PP2C-type Ser/Thr phosphatase [Aggregatilineales bacterium]
MFSPEYELQLRASQQSDQGRVRSNNEDSVLILESEKCLLAIVADGMGGAVAGEEASRIAVETIQAELMTDAYPQPESYSDMDIDELAELMGESVIEASNRIYQRALENPHLKGMGTTLTMAFVRQNGIVLAHVGDSRAYLLDEHDGMRRITSDHSFVQALIDAGHITEEEAENHPMKNVLYRALGQSAEELEVDTDDVSLYSGNRLLLCSDGLTLHLDDDEIEDILQSGDNADDICKTLVDTANARGGGDNITVVVVLADADTESVDYFDESISEADYEDNDPTLPGNRPVSILPSEHPVDTPTPPSEAYSGTYGEGNDIRKPIQ